MVLSDRDKRLLMILLITVILVGSYMGFTKLSEQNEVLEQEVRDLSQKHSDLVTKNVNKGNYEADAIANGEEFLSAFNKYNSSLSQEQTLLFLASVEKNTGVWLKQQSLENTSQIYQFGRITSSNPSRYGELVYRTDNVGISTNTSVSYECSYDQLKEVLTYLRENGKKVTINSMSYSYTAETDKVTGTMSLTFYAITGSDREPQDIDIKDVFIGTDNIFSSDTFFGSGDEVSYREQIITNYDLYVIVNRTGADKNSVICGQAGDPDNSTVISSNEGGIEYVTIVVSGREGNYGVKYKIGNQAYPFADFDGVAPFICGDSIELLVYSSLRGGTTDSSEIRLTVINESDLAVNGAVIGDDPENPRVILDKKEGAVTFYE